MNKFFTLLKVDLINGFSLNKNFSKNKKNRKSQKSSSLGLTILVFALLMISSSSYALLIGTLANSANMLEVLLAYGIVAGAMVVLMMTFTNAYGKLFKSRDYELLASLPISTKIIVASKIVSLTIIDYAYFGMVFIPAIVVYFIYAGISIYLLMASLIILLFGPLLVTSICSFIAYLFGSIVSHFKNKNTISTILYVLLTFLLIGGIYAINLTMPSETDSLEIQVEYAQRMYKIFTSIYPIAIIAIKGILGNYLYLLMYVGIMIIPYILFVLIIASRYEYINTHTKSAYKKTNYELTKDASNAKGLMRTLLSKETKTLFATPVYLTNAIIGPVMSAVVIILGSYMITYKIVLEGDGSGTLPYAIAPNVICLLCLFLTGISPASVCGISMEGKKFWVIKSLPIDEKKYLRSKILFSYILMGPIALISVIVACIIAKVNWLDLLCIACTSQVACVLYSFIGLLLNLKFYNLDWDNPNQAVKQGSNIFLAMLIDFGFFSQAAIIFFLGITFMISLTWAMLIYMIIACLIFGLILRKYGTSMYNRISA